MGMFQCTIDDAVAIKENCPGFHLVLSHLVWAAFSLGWDTSKCQITA
jgi:hypothetical protein